MYVCVHAFMNVCKHAHTHKHTHTHTHPYTHTHTHVHTYAVLIKSSGTAVAAYASFWNPTLPVVDLRYVYRMLISVGLFCLRNRPLLP